MGLGCANGRLGTLRSPRGWRALGTSQYQRSSFKALGDSQRGLRASHLMRKQFLQQRCSEEVPEARSISFEDPERSQLVFACALRIPLARLPAGPGGLGVGFPDLKDAFEHPPKARMALKGCQ